MLTRQMLPLAALLTLAACSPSPRGDGAVNPGAGGTSLSAGGGPDGGGTATAGSGGATSSSGGATAGSGGAEAADGGTSATSGGAPTSSGGAASSTGGNAGSGGSAAEPSSGCGKPASPVSGRQSINVGGTEREYILTLPDDYAPSTPYRLIFGFHGREYDAEWVANGEEPLTGPYFGLAGESGGQAIFVAPQALSSSWNNQGGRDIAFVQAMIAHFTADLCVDQERIFSAGFSYGAIMTISIGCELGEVFRAIAAMSGALTNGCPSSERPIAYWASHGLLDESILPAQGEAARDEFLSRNHCGAQTASSEPTGCVSYPGCDEGYPVSWCTFDGVHEPAPFAGSAIWQFFAQF